MNQTILMPSRGCTGSGTAAGLGGGSSESDQVSFLEVRRSDSRQELGILVSGGSAMIPPEAMRDEDFERHALAIPELATTPATVTNGCKA